MHYFLLIYFNNRSLHVSSRFAAEHQEDQHCTNSSWYSHAICWLAASSYTKYTNCCLYRVDRPDDEQQGCSKHVEAYYWNKLKENSTPFWFILYVYITMHGQQNIKFIFMYCTLYSFHILIKFWILRTDFRKILKYQFYENPSSESRVVVSSGRTDGQRDRQTDRRTDM